MLVKNILGQRFSRLTVISWAGKGKYGHALLHCRCDCGQIKIIFATNLLRGETRSCGCLQIQNTRLRFRTHGMSGRNKTRAYESWQQMKRRCQNPKNKSFRNYGARGIKICPEWEIFENFYRDMGDRPPKHSLDRKDNNGPYSPENCRWATCHEQNSNKRTNRMLSFNGMTFTMKEWSRQIGIKYTTLHMRLTQYGWSVEKALTEP